MARATSSPSAASGANWHGTSRATGPFDADYAIWPLSSGTRGWISLTGLGLDAQIGSSRRIVGLEVRLRVLPGAELRSQHPDEPALEPILWDPQLEHFIFEVAPVVDGAVQESGLKQIAQTLDFQWRSQADHDTPPLIVLGGVLDLWGIDGLTAEQARSAGFGVAVRSAADPSTQDVDVLLDGAEVSVFHSGSADDMATRHTVRQFPRIAKETTPGTAVAANRRLKGMNLTLNEQVDFGEHRPAGEKLTSEHPVLAEHAEGSIEEAELNYDEIGIPLSSVIAKPVTSNPATGVYEHIFQPNRLLKDDIQTFSYECGEVGENGEKANFLFFNSLDFGFGNRENRMGGTVMARQLLGGQTLSPGTNEQQTITFSASPTGGTLKLRFRGAESAAITGSGSMASAIETALEALSPIGSGGVSVSGSGTSYTVTFQGDLAGLQLDALEVADNSLTPSATITIAEGTAGGFAEHSIIPCLPAHWQAFLADSYGDLAAGQIALCFEAGFSISGRAQQVWAADRSAGTGPLAIAEQPLDVSMTLNGETNGEINDLFTKARANQTVFARIGAEGPLITGTSTNHSLEIDGPFKVVSIDPYGDEQGVYAKGFGLKPVFDADLGRSFRVKLVNGVSAY